MPMRALLKPFLEKFVIPICAAAITWVVTEKLQVDLIFQIGVIALSALAALFASFAVADEKDRGNDPEPNRRSSFVTLLIVMLMCIVAAIGIGYWGLKAKQENGTSIAVTSTEAIHPGGTLGPGPGVTQAAQKPKDAGKRASDGSNQVEPVPDSLDIFLQKYVDIGLTHRADKPRWGVVVSNREKSGLPEVSAAVSETISEAGYENVAMFRPALVRDGRSGDLYSADPALMRRLGPYCDGIVVVMADQTQIPDNGLQGVLTVELAVRVRVIAVPSATVKREFSVLERGAGFTVHEAELNARERVAQGLRTQLKVSF